jgi:hypothetical protein
MRADKRLLTGNEASPGLSAGVNLRIRAARRNLDLDFLSFSIHLSLLPGIKVIIARSQDR